jgi:hypothetical protein
MYKLGIRYCVSCNQAFQILVMTKTTTASKLETGRRIKNLSLINGNNERTIVDHAPFVGSIVPAVMRFFQANIEEGSRSLLSA